MAPQQKRPTPEPASNMPDAKKRVTSFLRQQGISSATLKQVTAVLNHPLADDLSAACRQMLEVMLPFALCVPRDLRDEHQEMCVSMIGEVLMSIEGNMEEAIAVEAKKVIACHAPMVTLEAHVADADTAYAAAGVAAGKCGDILATVSATLSGKQQTLDERRKVQERADAELEQIKVIRVELAEVFNGNFKALQNRAGEVSECERLQVAAGRLDIDTSLVHALPTVLTKHPCERGPFDRLAFQEFGDKLQAKIGSLVQQIMAEKLKMDNHAWATAQAFEEVEVAKAAKQDAARQFRSATEAQFHAEAEVVAAKKALSDYAPECDRARECQRGREHELEVFRGTVGATFAELRDRTSARQAKREATSELAVDTVSVYATRAAGA